MNKRFEILRATDISQIIQALNGRDDFFSVVHMQVAHGAAIAIIDTEPLTMEIGLTDEMEEPPVNEQKPPSFA